MNNLFSVEKICKKRIKENTGKCIDRDILYELNEIKYCGGKRYEITVTLDGESCTCCFGKNKKDVSRIYGTIVKNTVTPCTLRDIAEDFSHSCEYKHF